MDDSTLFRRIRARDVSALGELYDRHSTSLFSVALRILRAEPDPQTVAEEILVAVFSDLWHRAAPVLAADDTPAWLLSGVRRRALDRRTVQSRPTTALPVSGSACLQAGDLPGLTWLQRTALELTYFDGLSRHEVAACVDLDVASVERALADGLQALRTPMTIVSQAPA